MAMSGHRNTITCRFPTPPVSNKKAVMKMLAMCAISIA